MKTLGFAAALVTMPALAQEPPTPMTLGTGPAAIRGEWKGPRDVDGFSIKLSSGGDFAVGARTDVDNSIGYLTVRAPGGAVVGRRLVIGNEQAVGFEFRSKVAGSYRVEVVEGGSNPPFPVPYQFTLSADCRASSATTCKIRPGETKRHFTSSINDVDWHQLIGLTIGRQYTITGAEVVTAGGALVARPGAFTAKTSPLFARVKPFTSEPWSYSISLR